MSLDFFDWEKLGGMDLNKDGKVDFLEYDLLYGEDEDENYDFNDGFDDDFDDI